LIIILQWIDSQVSEICQSAFYHIRDLRHIRLVITDEVVKTITCSFITYVSTMPTQCCMESLRKIYSLPSANAERPHVLGSSASKFSHSTDMLCHLYWLPAQYRIKFKLALLAFNAGNNAPLYLLCLLHNYVLGCSLRSSQSNLLYVPSHKLNLVHVVSTLPHLLYGTHFRRHLCMYILCFF